MRVRGMAVFYIVIFLVALVGLSTAPPVAAQSPVLPSESAVPAGADNQNVELVAQIGGDTFTVDVQGNYAYIGLGPRLAVLDVSDPASPVRVGQSEVLSGIVWDVEVVGDFAYVMDNDYQLSIFNVSNPGTVEFVGGLEIRDFENTHRGPGEIRIAVSGNYAYVTDGTTGLHIIDVSTPSAPELVRLYDIWYGQTRDVAVRGNYVYLAALGTSTPDGTFGGGLYVLDVSTPTAPEEVAYLEANGAAGLAIEGDYAYVLSSFGTQYTPLSILDISDPSNPTVVGTYTDSESEVVDANDLFVANDHAYLATRAGLWIMDVADPTSPSAVSSVELRPLSDVVVVGDDAYVAGNGGLTIVETANEQAPSVIGTYRARNVVMTAIADNKAYVVSSTGLRIYDVTDPSSPSYLGTFNQGGRIVAVVGNYAYLATAPGIRIIDVSNPAAPQEVGVYETPQGEGIYDFVVNGNYLYLALGRSLLVVDVADPTAPTVVNTYNEFVFSLTLAGENLFAGGGYAGVLVFNVSNPDTPLLINTIDTPGDALDVGISGTTMYVADGYEGIYVVDVSDPFFPEEITSYSENLQYASEIVMHGNYAYITIGMLPNSRPYNDLVVVDVSDPAAPQIVGFYDTPGSSEAVTASGNEVYVSDDDGGLFILRFVPPVPTAVVLSVIEANSRSVAVPVAVIGIVVLGLAAHLGRRRLLR